jgi:hypothetical protein
MISLDGSRHGEIFPFPKTNIIRYILSFGYFLWLTLRRHGYQRSGTEEVGSSLAKSCQFSDKELSVFSYQFSAKTRFAPVN